jgi:hypothetical protein
VKDFVKIAKSEKVRKFVQKRRVRQLSIDETQKSRILVGQTGLDAKCVTKTSSAPAVYAKCVTKTVRQLSTDESRILVEKTGRDASSSTGKSENTSLNGSTSRTKGWKQAEISFRNAEYASVDLKYRENVRDFDKVAIPAISEPNAEREFPEIVSSFQHHHFLRKKVRKFVMLAEANKSGENLAENRKKFVTHKTEENLAALRNGSLSSLASPQAELERKEENDLLGLFTEFCSFRRIF